MILAIDIGNTNITLGCYDRGELIFVSRMFTERHKASDEFATQLLEIFKLYSVSPSDFSASVLSSVVPELTDTLVRALEATLKIKPVLVGKENNGKLKVEVLPIEQLGADLICDCVAACEKYPLPCLIVDMGTATKILAVDGNGYFVGCTISPGVKISLDALASKAALLPSISFTKPRHVAGTNTIECMQSGCVYGTAAMIDGMIERMNEELNFGKATVVATGGLSKGIIECCKTSIIYDENLTLDGLKVILEKSEK